MVADYVSNARNKAFSLTAELFGVKELLPAYLDPALQIQDLLTSVSFSSGTSGYDPQTSKSLIFISVSLVALLRGIRSILPRTRPSWPTHHASVTTFLVVGRRPSSRLTLAWDELPRPRLCGSEVLVRQWQMVGHHNYCTHKADHLPQSIARIKVEVGDEKAASIGSESIHILCMGSNDIANTFFGPLRRHMSSHTDLMVNWSCTDWELNLPPVGCLPGQRTLRGGFKRHCFEDGNNAALLFNSKISSLTDSLSSQLSGSKIVYLEIYDILLSLIQNSTQYGFEVSAKGCSGTGSLEVGFLCNRLDVFLSCKDDEKYVFWDSFHPTEKAYKIIVENIKVGPLGNKSTFKAVGGP
ncbi:hypothetical protein CRG98_044167 [Punica granatum]|uniref:GDSL esterase/lipase n=1 Tax=Punica granatum TaxID=22663 RepID=A0A2I0HUR0_PUNGR|nr:hypothetical protein CRG98_044167 [Punica granatum]